MCPRDKHDRAHGIMDLDLFKKSINEVTYLGAERIVLTGFGEPLLDKGLEDKVAYCKSKHLHTNIITNASCITEARARGLLEAGLDEMRISFYGMDSNTYNTVMRGLEYKNTTINILRLLALIDEYKSTIKIWLSYLVLPENEKDTDAFREFWEPKVHAVEVWHPHNFGDGRDYRQRTEQKSTCGRPANGPLQIQWNGEVIPCCYDYNNQIVLGNAFEQPVMEILDGDKYNALRDAHEKGEFHKFPYCDQCDQLLPHEDALVYSSRHDLPASEAVKLSNTDLYNLIDGKEIIKIAKRA
jgi:radical SAM protein with 4Fe4S-binding SPASM domain